MYTRQVRANGASLDNFDAVVEVKAGSPCLPSGLRNKTFAAIEPDFSKDNVAKSYAAAVLERESICKE